MEYNIRTVGLKDLGSLETFIQNLGESSKTFRYFDKRPLDVIKNHVLTVLVTTKENKEIGYGHLDQEDGDIWLGIAVADKFRGKGVGKLIMEFLLDYANKKGIEKLKLAVDKVNEPALKMYYQWDFEVLKELETAYIMVKYG